MTRGAGKPFVEVELSEATHAFFDERTDRYHAPSAAQPWAIATALLDGALGRPGAPPRTPPSITGAATRDHPRP